MNKTIFSFGFFSPCAAVFRLHEGRLSLCRHYGAHILHAWVNGTSDSVQVPSHAGIFPSHSGIFPSHAGTFPSHAGTFPSHAGTFPSHAGTFPSHAGTFPSHAGTFPSHAGIFPSHAGRGGNRDRSAPPAVENGKERTGRCTARLPHREQSIFEKNLGGEYYE
jgi:hypothetical protein